MILIMEMSVQFDDIGMIQLIMYFKFSSELIDHIVFQYGRFEDFLQCKDGPRLFMDTNVDISELARPHQFAQLEILK